MKGFAVVIGMTLALSCGLAAAGNFSSPGKFQITVGSDWLQATSAEASSMVKAAQQKGDASGIKQEYRVEELPAPLILYKQTSSDLKLVRVLIAPGELSAKQFESASLATLKGIGESIAKEQAKTMAAVGITVLSSTAEVSSFKGRPALLITHQTINSKGMKVSRGQYMIYRESATILVTMEHTVLAGEPDYRTIESQVTDFQVLAN